MRICFVAPANNYHTKKWANWFLGRGHEIHVVSFIKDEISGVTVHHIDTGAGPDSGDASKLKYLLHAKDLKRIIDQIKPDIINVHYATSYGTVAALSGIKPYVLSVWGTDIYDFPNRSAAHKVLLKYSLSKAKWLFSTSKAMAEEASKYTDKEFEITPFGVDMELFNPKMKTYLAPDKITIGTVKKLEPVYGIDYLLKAVVLVREECPNIKFELRIAGSGINEKEYQQLAKKLKLDDITVWLGFISQDQVAKEWAGMDIAVVYSNQESFGVSAIEAQACGTPLIISDVQGLKEATNPNCSCLVVEKKNQIKLSKAILELVVDEDKRRSMGEQGRKYVEERFEINNCFAMIERSLCEKSQKE